MAAVLDFLARPPVIISILGFVLVQIYNILTAPPSKLPANVPWVGKDSSKIFAETRAHLSSFTTVQQSITEGYRKYSKKGLSYILPDFSGRAEIVIPRTQLPWLLEQSDDILSASAFHFDSLEGNYAFTNKKILEDPYHEHVIHKYLPRKLPLLIPDIWDEVVEGFDESWGTDTENWKEIPVYNSVMFMISRAVNRMIVGLPLCRNEDFLSNMRSFAMDIIMTGVVLRFTPSWLRSIVGPIAAMPNNKHYRACAKYTVPLITERLAQFQKKAEDPSSKWEPPNDFVSWSVALASAEGRADELTVDMLSRRVMPIGFASIHTTTIAITNCLLDLVAAESSSGFLEGIRQESAAIYAEDNGLWTKANLAKCHRADSALRESMRVSNFMTRNAVRKVMPKDGIVNPTEGWRAPHGAYLSVDMHNIQHDEDFYPNAERYDAFRFSRSKEETTTADTTATTTTKDKLNSSNGAAKSDGANQHLEQKNTGLVTTSDTFLAFSHGRHACPGRYLIAVEIKLMLAYMTMNYDIEPLPVRPVNKWFGATCVPSEKATIRIRRKAGTVRTL